MPVPIIELAREFADVDAVDFPEDIRCDAAVIFHPIRPRLVLNTLRVSVRQRFSVGHELGHIVLAWHAGTAFCDPIPRLAEPGASGDEGEANTFASEVLLPRSALAAPAEIGDVRSLIELCITAEVSDAAMVRAASDALPPGFALVLCRAGVVETVNVSPGTHTITPYRGQSFNPKDHGHYSKDADACGRVSTRTRTVYWWSFDAPKRPVGNDGLGSSRDILETILQDVESQLGPAEALAARRSISGVIGSAFGSSPVANADELVALFHQRFVNRTGTLRLAQQHPLFQAFIWSRAEALAAKHRAAGL